MEKISGEIKIKKMIDCMNKKTKKVLAKCE